MILLEVTLERDHATLGVKGDTIFISDGYIVAIKKEPDGHSIVFLDLSDLDKFTEVHIDEPFDMWRVLRLNP